MEQEKNPKKKYPYLPPNYLSLRDLQQRRLQEQKQKQEDEEKRRLQFEQDQARLKVQAAVDEEERRVGAEEEAKRVRAEAEEEERRARAEAEEKNERRKLETRKGKMSLYGDGNRLRGQAEAEVHPRAKTEGEARKVKDEAENEWLIRAEEEEENERRMLESQKLRSSQYRGGNRLKDQAKIMEHRRVGAEEIRRGRNEADNVRRIRAVEEEIRRKLDTQKQRSSQYQYQSRNITDHSEKRQNGSSKYIEHLEPKEKVSMIISAVEKGRKFAEVENEEEWRKLEIQKQESFQYQGRNRPGHYEDGRNGSLDYIEYSEAKEKGSMIISVDEKGRRVTQVETQRQKIVQQNGRNISSTSQFAHDGSLRFIEYQEPEEEMIMSCNNITLVEEDEDREEKQKHKRWFTNQCRGKHNQHSNIEEVMEAKEESCKHISLRNVEENEGEGKLKRGSRNISNYGLTQYRYNGLLKSRSPEHREEGSKLEEAEGRRQGETRKQKSTQSNGRKVPSQYRQNSSSEDFEYIKQKEKAMVLSCNHTSEQNVEGNGEEKQNRDFIDRSNHDQTQFRYNGSSSSNSLELKEDATVMSCNHSFREEGGEEKKGFGNIPGHGLYRQKAHSKNNEYQKPNETRIMNANYLTYRKVEEMKVKEVTQMSEFMNIPNLRQYRDDRFSYPRSMSPTEEPMVLAKAEENKEGEQNQKKNKRKSKRKFKQKLEIEESKLNANRNKRLTLYEEHSEAENGVGPMYHIQKVDKAKGIVEISIGIGNGCGGKQQESAKHVTAQMMGKGFDGTAGRNHKGRVWKETTHSIGQVIAKRVEESSMGSSRGRDSYKGWVKKYISHSNSEMMTKGVEDIGIGGSDGGERKGLRNQSNEQKIEKRVAEIGIGGSDSRANKKKQLRYKKNCSKKWMEQMKKIVDGVEKISIDDDGDNNNTTTQNIAKEAEDIKIGGNGSGSDGEDRKGFGRFQAVHIKRLTGRKFPHQCQTNGTNGVWVRKED